MQTGTFRGSQSIALRLVLAAGAAVATGSIARAQTWTGLSAVDSNWTTAANWTALPVNNGTANVIFAGLNRTSVVVGVAEDVNSVTFNNTAGIFNIGGASTLTTRAGGIINNDAQAQGFSCPVIAAVSQTWSAASGPINLSGAVSVNSGLTLDGAFPITFGGTSSGLGSITKNGPAVWLLSGASTVSGGFLLTAGTLRLGANNVLPDAGLLTFTGLAILDVNGAVETVGGLGSTSANAQIQLPGNSALTFGGANVSSNFAGIISGGAGAGLTKTGAGTFTLSGDSTFPGQITIQNGAIALASSERLADTCTVTITATGSLLLPANGVETVGVFFGLSGFLDGPSTATLITTGGAFLGDGSSFVHIAGSGGLTKNYPGNYFLRNSNSYAGSTSISAGTLVIGVSDAIPNTSTIAFSNATLAMLAGVRDTVGILSGNGIIAFPTSGALPELTIGSGNASATFSGVITGGGALVKTGFGTQTLLAGSTNVGPLTINDGAVVLGNSERLADTSDVTINNGSLGVTSIETIRNFTLNAGGVFSNGPDIATLSVQGTATLQSGGVNVILAGPADVLKQGAGTVQFTQPNLYAGGTTINAGVLEIAQDSGLGAAGAPLLLGGTGLLRILGSTSMNRPVTIAGNSTLDIGGDVSIPSANLTGASLTKVGAGTLTLPVFAAPTSLAITNGRVSIPAGASLTSLALSTSGRGGLAIGGGIVSLGGVSALSNGGSLEFGPGGRFIGPITNSGVMSGPGRVNGAITTTASGTIRVGTGESFVNSGTLSNSGLVQVLGGSFECTALASNEASTGLIFARDGEFHFDGGLINFGGIAASFGTTDFFGDIDNRAGGVITISGGSDATFVDDVINNGTLRTSAGGHSVFLGAVSGSGSFPGTGIVYLEGDLRPGNSPGLVTFGGDVVFGSFSSLVEELAGTNLNQFDRTAITGTAYLDGSLDVRLYGGYIPSGIQTFTILTADQVNGRFQSVNLPPTNPPLRVIYTDTAVVVSNCAADFNNDAVVDFFDYLDFVAAFAAGGVTADFNQDSVIDFFDYLDFVQAFSAGC